MKGPPAYWEAEQAMLYVIKTLGINLPKKLASSLGTSLTNWSGEEIGDIVIRNHE